MRLAVALVGWSALVIVLLLGPAAVAGATTNPVITTTAPALLLVGQPLTDHYSITMHPVTTGTVNPPGVTILATIYGPVTPPAGGCSTLVGSGTLTAVAHIGVHTTPVQWTAFPAHSVATQHALGDTSGTLVATTPITAPGCYGWALSLVYYHREHQETVIPTSTLHGVTQLGQLGLAATTSPNVVLVGQEVTDQLAVTGALGVPATVSTSLLGPLPASSGCGSITQSAWSAAPSEAMPDTALHTATTGNGTYQVGSANPMATGCYAWAIGASAAGSAVGALAPTVSGQQFLVSQANVTGKVSGTPSAAGGATIANRVTLSGTGGLSVGLTATLWGPVAPSAYRCASVTWAAAPTVTTEGSSAVAAGSPYTVPSVSVSGPGCYTWALQLTAAGVTVATLPPGTPSETLVVSTLGTSVGTRSTSTRNTAANTAAPPGSGPGALGQTGQGGSAANDPSGAASGSDSHGVAAHSGDAAHSSSNGADPTAQGNAVGVDTRPVKRSATESPSTRHVEWVVVFVAIVVALASVATFSWVTRRRPSFGRPRRFAGGRATGRSP